MGWILILSRFDFFFSIKYCAEGAAILKFLSSIRVVFYTLKKKKSLWILPHIYNGPSKKPYNFFMRVILKKQKYQLYVNYN